MCVAWPSALGKGGALRHASNSVAIHAGSQALRPRYLANPEGLGGGGRGMGEGATIDPQNTQGTQNDCLGALMAMIHGSCRARSRNGLGDTNLLKPAQGGAGGRVVCPSLGGDQPVEEEMPLSRALWGMGSEAVPIVVAHMPTAYPPYTENSDCLRRGLVTSPEAWHCATAGP